MLSKDKNYLTRSTILYALQEVVPYAEGENLEKVVSLICQLASDPIPNVRMIVAKVARASYKAINSDKEKAILKQHVQELLKD